MAQSYFVIGIGGTGMRCIESLIHLCSMGMFDDTDIHLLAMDTDLNNGNFNRLKEVKDCYLETKGTNPKLHTALKDTFFSAKIHYYEFSPNYVNPNKTTFNSVFKFDDKEKSQQDLVNLVFTDNIKNFNLQMGYRAQTHLGSMMMYHSILDAVQSEDSNDLKDFIEKLISVANAGDAKVFILGSVFGGTGASSIPIIPHAISKAAELMTHGAANILDNFYFGSTLLTAYFNFNMPTRDDWAKQKVIATSDKFALNSQASMMFYYDDMTVKSTYQKFYMLGTPKIEWNPMAGKEHTHVIIGGTEQKNDSHYIELLAACAALDFLKIPKDKLKSLKEHKKTDYLYRAVDDNDKLEFKDFVGQELELEFAKKWGMLIIFSILCNGDDDIVNHIKSNFMKFKDIDQNQIDGIKKYFRLFHFSDKDNRLSERWLRQLYRSAGSGDNFLFNTALFIPNTLRELMEYKYNTKLYKKEGVGKERQFTATFGRFNAFKGRFTKIQEKTPATIQNPGEQSYKYIYDTLVSLYKF